MRTISLIATTAVAAALVAPLSACATAAAPTELVRARAAYEHARIGASARYAPAALYDAELALHHAERAYLDDGADDRTRDLAYLAERRAQLAEARGRTMQAAERQRLAARDAERATQRRIATAQDQIERERDARTSAQRALSREQIARAEAERRASQALASLRELSAVRAEADRTVLTISGEVLFVTGQATLLPSAQSRLEEVAQSLLDYGFEQITVEGHTDSRGGFGFNEELSLRRARAVRDFLVSRGIPAEQIQAVGYGETRPVADNNTPEGRANNRRVELVVRPTQGATEGS